MAATRIDGHKPLPRSESLQKMLDLEKQYKLARLQQIQTSPKPGRSAMSFQPQIRPPVPIQTRRRDSRESLYQQHQQHQQQLDQITTAVRRTGPASPLSITIPSPTDPNEKALPSQRSQRPPARNMAAESDVKPNGGEDSGDTTPREKSVEFSAQTKFEDDDDDFGEMSDQSSICQSPSWEGYGQKKKDKKKKQEAELRKKEKERIEQELRAASKKRASNRLYKSPPLEGPDLNSHRPSSSASSRLDSSHGLGTKSGRFTPSSNQGLIPEVWGMAMGSGFSSSKSRPGYSRATSAAGSYAEQDASRAQTLTMSQIQQQNASGGKKSTSSDERPTSSNDKVSYPPTSSRSHALRNILPSTHSRQNSNSTITPVPSKPEDSSSNSKNGHRMYSMKNMSDQSLTSSTEKLERGRQLVDPAGSGSYVRKARAQSIERSIKGFMQEAALSDPNLLNGPNRTQFAYLGPPQHQQQSNGHRPSSSQSKITKPSGTPNATNGVNGTASAAAQQEKKGQQQPQQPSRPQHQHPLQQNQPPAQSVQPKQQNGAPSVPEKTKSQSPDKEKDGDANTDYINFVSKPYSPPSLELATPTSGIFSSIKSRIGRRGSTSSGSTSNTNNTGHTGRSFKERAMNVIHLQAQNNVSLGAVASTIPMSQPPSRMHSQNSVQTAASSIVSTSTKNESSSASHSLQIPQKDTRRLPKAARILGEINQETMSQGAAAGSRPSEGSSTSSYHDDSSIPPSPASTPDTSRPQSAKGLSATIEEIQIGSPEMFNDSKEDLTLTKPKQSEKTQATVKETTVSPAESKETAPSDHTTQQSQPPRPASRTESVPNITMDRPSSKGRLLEDLERPISRGRLLENIERPESRARGAVEDKPTQPNGQTEKASPETKNEETTPGANANLSEGLGILDEAWSQSTVTLDNDAQSFVTTLTNQKSGASLKSQFGSLKEAALLAEAQNSLGVHPALLNHDNEPAPPAYNHALQEVDETVYLYDNNGVEEHLQPSPEKTLQRSSFRKADKRNSRQAKHMSVVNEEPRPVEDDSHGDMHQDQRMMSPTPDGSDPRQTSIDVSFLPPLRHEAFIPPKSKARNSPPSQKTGDNEAQQPSQNETTTLTSAPPTAAPEQAPPSGRSSPSAMYLQEARRSAPLVSSPLSNVIRTAKANMSTPALARPGLKTSASFTSGQTHHHHPHHHLAHPASTFLPLPPAPSTSTSSSSSSGSTPPSHSGKSPTSPRFRIPAHEPEQLAKQSAQSKPRAKMLVECCNCKFFHDMPSRVYECMAQPDAVVTDRDLGVSGAITTMVKCPWCSHNMSTQCCAGYAAVVYLKERLH